MKRAIEPARIYQLKITLVDINPAIWRRVLVPGDITLDRLHLVIQATMDWYDSPLHEFHRDEKHYGTPAHDDLYDIEDETSVMLSQVVSRPGMAFEYDYDYDEGNDWRHEIVLEEILRPEGGVQYPVCIAGAGARPPRNCGGFEGHTHFLCGRLPILTTRITKRCLSESVESSIRRSSI